MSPRTAFVVLSIFGAVACGGSVPPPNDQWAAAQADVGRAQSGGAPENPDARLHLQLAQEDLQTAKALIDHDNRRASTLTELARVEAQLALSLAKSAAAESSVQRASQDLRQVQTQPPGQIQPIGVTQSQGQTMPSTQTLPQAK